MQEEIQMQDSAILDGYDGIYSDTVEIEQELESDNQFNETTTESMNIPVAFEYQNSDGDQIAVTLDERDESGEETTLTYSFHDLQQPQTSGNPFRKVGEVEVSAKEANEYLTQRKDALAESYDDLLE